MLISPKDANPSKEKKLGLFSLNSGESPKNISVKSKEQNGQTNDKKENNNRKRKSPKDVQSYAKGLVGVVRPIPMTDYGIKRDIKTV